MWKLVDIVPNMKFWDSNRGCYFGYGYVIVGTTMPRQQRIVNKETYDLYKKEELKMCVNEYGKFDTNVNITLANGNVVQVDECLKEELELLISKGINTVASCCGHGISPGDIVVAGDDSIKAMEDLGYEHCVSNCYPDSKEFFYAKSKHKIK